MEVKPRICANLSTAPDLSLADLPLGRSLSRGRGPRLDAQSRPMAALPLRDLEKCSAISPPPTISSPIPACEEPGRAGQCGRHLKTTFEDHVPKDQLA
jgi:hypothetical protein